MHEIQANALLNRLYVSFTGRIDAGELKLAGPKLTQEAKLLKPGFAAIIDLTEFVPGLINSRSILLGLMRSLSDLGMVRAISVVRDLSAQEALSLSEEDLKDLDVMVDTALSVEGAEKLLDREANLAGVGSRDYEDRPAVLIIDDELSLLTVLSATMKRAGYNVYTANNGTRGLEKARKFLPDLILCDIMMPPPNGFKVREALAADPKTADIPFIFLTARTAKADVIYGLKSGADDYITKPFDRGELLARVEAVLRRGRLGLGKPDRKTSPSDEEIIP